MLREGNHEMRKVYVDTLMELAATDKDVIAMEADLAGSIGTSKFRDAFPDQFINCGIMEAQMACAAAGLSIAGKRPFMHTFATFATRRAYDQIFISLAYSGLGATIVGSDAGISAEFNGGTHMPFEDMGIMRMMHNCIVAEPSDEHMFKALLKLSYEKGGLWYIRTTRKKVAQIYDESIIFEPGKAKVLKKGKDVMFIASGLCVAESLEACDELSKKGVDAGVIDMFMLNPLDNSAIIDAIDLGAKIITVENHFVNNGLGSAVAEVIAEHGKAVKFQRLGVKDKYGQTGSLDFLKKEYGIDKDSIVEAATN